MLRFLFNKTTKRLSDLALLLSLGIFPSFAGGIETLRAFEALNRPATIQTQNQEKNLQLEVFINNEPSKLVASFRQDAAGKLYATVKELREIGLEPGENLQDDAELPLESLKGVRYTLDPQAQALRFEATSEARLTRNFQANSLEREGGKLQHSRDYGAVVNYSLYSAVSRDFGLQAIHFQGVSANLDARIFGPLGTFSHSMLFGNATNFVRPQDIRLDSSWSYSHEASMTTSKLGDYITGGLAWTRPIRMGGFQMQRNFGLRPDLIAHALPSASGTALVPSTVDVYVNNMRTYSQEVPSGPFRIGNLPVSGSNGQARIVVRDVTGRQTETTQNFFVSPNLLGKGMLDFSMQAGYARFDYGLQSNNYSNRFAAIGSLRYGLSDNLTLETHGEATSRFGLAGLGLVTTYDKRHLFTIAGSFSQFETQKGGQVFASYETNYKGVFFAASTQRTFGAYMDLAAVSAKPMPLQTLSHLNPLGLTNANNGAVNQLSSTNPFALSLLPMKAMDRVSLGVSLESLKASLSLSHVHLLSAENVRAHLTSLSFNKTLNADTSFFATAYMDRGDRRNYGVFAGLSVQLDRHTSANLGVSNDPTGTLVTAELARPQSQLNDTWGYRIRDSEGKFSARFAQASYRAKVGLGEVTVAQQGTSSYASAYVEGGVAVAGGGVFAANRMDDGFAVVKTGVKGAEILQENRPVGVTNGSGKLLIPHLRSNESNRLSLNPNSLPLSAAVETTKTLAMPKDRGVTVVDFGVNAAPNAALVSFVDKQNKPITLGTTVTLENGKAFVVGHEGQSYLMGLSPQNTVVLHNDKMSCTAQFAFNADAETQVKIHKVPCL